MLAKSELRDRHALIPLELFLSAKSSIYYPGSLVYRLASNLVAKPLRWTLQNLNLADGNELESDTQLWKKVKGKYVALGNLEAAADAVLEIRRKQTVVSRADSLYSVESFKKAFGGVGVLFPGISLSDVDVQVLVLFLRRDRKAIVNDAEVSTLICFETPSK